MKTYDILVSSLSRSANSITEKWCRGIKANSLTEASKIACDRYPNLGVTPTTMSMGWFLPVASKS